MSANQAHNGHSDATAPSRKGGGGSLTRRLLGWFLAVALVPMTLVSAISYDTAKESLREDAYESLAAAVDDRVAFIENWFHYRLIDLEAQATSVSNARFLEELRDAFASGGEHLGGFVRGYRWNAIVAERGEDLATFRKLYEYHDVYLIDLRGNILFTVGRGSDLGTNLFDEPLADTRFAGAYRKALNLGRPAFSDLEDYGPSDAAADGFLTDVIVDEAGEKIGVFALQIAPEQIAHATRVMSEADGDHRAYLVGYSAEHGGVTLRTAWATDGSDGGAPMSQGSRTEGSSDYLGHRVDTEQTRLWLAEHGPDGTKTPTMIERTLVYVGPDGRRVLGTHRDISVAGVDWGVIAEIPEQVAFAPARHLKHLVLGLLLATAVLVVMIASITARRIVRPIVQLSHAAKLVAEGDMTQSIESNATDEIGDLARAFNGMVSNLSSLFAELENQKYALDRHAIVSIADIRGDITYVNDNLCEISGYSRDELIGRNHRMIKSDEHPPEFYRDMWKTLAGGRAWSGEIKNRAKDGTHYWVDATIVPFKDIAGKITQYVAIRTDISIVKFSQQRLEQANLEIEGRTEELEAQQLELIELNASMEEAQARAMMSSQAKSDFLANMSHEIRTPMTAILGFAENMLDTEQSESERMSCVHTIRRNGEYLLGLINDILDLSKIEAGKMTVEHRSCKPCEIVAEVVSLMRVRSEARGLPFHIEYLGAIPETVQSDATRLRQVLINLIGNAIKFTELGDVRLVTRFVQDGDGSRLQFDVIDTGRGMSPEQKEKLFQPFTQADTSTTRKFGGTGLGLTISKRFAELLGGDIIVAASELGVGSTFRVTVATGAIDGVKMIEDPMAVTVVSETAGTPAQSTLTGLQGLRILLAEDGPDNQRLISFVLKKAGADVTVKEDGQLALDAALAARDEGHPFDVILMDMQMPVMDGYTATSELRRRGYTGPIIALTAHAMDGDREKCINAGCDDFATKPIQRRKLIETIQQHLAPADAASSGTT